MKILITGITGLLGSELVNTLEDKHELEGISIDKNIFPEITVYNVDLTEPKTTYDTISKINPDIVIHTAALTDVDECERNPDKAYKINALATRNVALACQRFDTIMLHISTDYVFFGPKTAKKPFKEYDSTNPLDEYAKSKLLAEEYVMTLLNKYFIVRTSWLFGSRRKNFVSQIAETLINKKEIKLVDDMISSPTYVKDLSKAIGKLIESNLFGLYHLCNNGYESRHKIGLEIAKIMKKPNSVIRKTSLSHLKLDAKRPNFSALDNYIWKLNNFVQLRPWQEAVKEFLREEKYI